VALTDIRRPTAPRSGAGGPSDRAPRRVRVPWPRTLLVAAALSAALASLHAVLQGLSWWLVGTVATLLVLITAAAVRAVARRGFWPPLASAAAGLGMLTLGYAADTAILGVIPTPGTFVRFGDLMEQATTSITEQAAPATPELGIVLLVAVLMIAGAWAADLVVAAGRPALVAVPLGAILVVPVAVKPGLVDAFWFIVTATLFLALLRLDRPRDSRRVVLAVGASVIFGALLLPNALPAVEEPPLRSGGLRSGLNPFITLGDDLRRGAPTLALSYTTTATRPVYLRLTTLDDFTGETWGPIVGGDRGEGLAEFPPPAGLDPETTVREAEVAVTVGGVASKWLPIPYPTRSIEGLEGDWFWEPEGLTVRTLGAGVRGQSYTASFLELTPSDEQLAATATPYLGEAPLHTLALPEQGLPDIIAETAHTVADGAESAFEKAAALQSYLRSSAFEYSEQTPVDEGFDGSGLEALAVFLERKSGYCVHYASAMAVMARELGIPSRVAVGFQPGDRRFVEGANIYDVSTDDLHAWPELYFEGTGWLRFEPTPTRGSLPRYGSTLVDDPTTPEDESSPEPTAAPTAAPGERPDIDDIVDDPIAEAAGQFNTAMLSGLGIVAAVVGVLLVPAAFRGVVRMLRVRRMRQGRDAAAAAWDEVRDTARDVGWSAPETETPRAFAARLAPQLPGAALGEFRGRVEASAYGKPDASGLSPEQLAAVRRSILRSADVRTRLAAFLLPASLVHRWQPDRDA